MYQSDDDEPIIFSEEVKKWESHAKELGGKATHFITLLDAAIGAAYRFDFGAIKLAVGGGAYCNYLYSTLRLTGTNEGGDKVDQRTDATFFTVGVSTLADARYMVSDKVGISLTVQPQIGIYSDRKITLYEHGHKEDSSIELTGVGISFTVPVSIGASYSF
jgi:hypothetical protein